MKKAKTITYWIATIWLCMGLFFTGIGQLSRAKTGAGSVEWVTELGYPLYILGLLGFWKIVAIIALLIPRYPLVKEWAYAGVVFMMTGAAYSHIASGDLSARLIPCFLLVVLAVLSWYFRPDSRKLPMLVKTEA